MVMISCRNKSFEEFFQGDKYPKDQSSRKHCEIFSGTDKRISVISFEHCTEV